MKFYTSEEFMNYLSLHGFIYSGSFDTYGSGDYYQLLEKNISLIVNVRQDGIIVFKIKYGEILSSELKIPSDNIDFKKDDIHEFVTNVFYRLVRENKFKPCYEKITEVYGNSGILNVDEEILFYANPTISITNILEPCKFIELNQIKNYLSYHEKDLNKKGIDSIVVNAKVNVMKNDILNKYQEQYTTLTQSTGESIDVLLSEKKHDITDLLDRMDK